MCFRHQPVGMTDEALDQHTLGWVQRMNRSGVAYLTPAIVDGRWIVRMSIGALPTEAADVAAAWQSIRQAAESAEHRQGSAMSRHPLGAQVVEIATGCKAMIVASTNREALARVRRPLCHPSEPAIASAKPP